MKKLMIAAGLVFGILGLYAAGASAGFAAEKNKGSVPMKGKILVAYFSHSGNTRRIAEQIHSLAGGDIAEIRAVQTYPKEYREATRQAKKELEENLRPAISTKVADIDSYSVVFVGYPIWWGTMPMPVFTFLEGHNLKGKTIIPFCTHEGSRTGRSVEDIRRVCPSSTVREGLAVRGRDVQNAQEDVAKWLRAMGLAK